MLLELRHQLGGQRQGATPGRGLRRADELLAASRLLPLGSDINDAMQQIPVLAGEAEQLTAA